MEFATYLSTAQGPMAEVIRDNAAFLAERWRVHQPSRRQRRAEVARWLEHEVHDALLLRTHSKTRNLHLKSQAELLLRAAPQPPMIEMDVVEITEYIAAHF